MREIPITLLLKCLTLKRIVNVLKVISSFLWSMITKKPIIWGSPFILNIEPTNVCNLKCPLCVTGNGKLTRTAGMLDLESYKRILDQIGDTLIYLILYHQGEPYLNKNFIKFVELAKSKRIFVTTSTNAHYFDTQNAEQTVRSGLDSIIVSLDGLDQNTYEIYRKNGHFGKVQTGIQNLVNARTTLKSKTPRIYLQFIVMRHNENQLKELDKFAATLGVDKVLLKTAQVETMDEAKNWLPQQDKYRRYHLNNALMPKRTAPGPCQRPWTSALINCDSSVSPCCFDKNGTHITGQITNESDLSKIWKSDDYAHFRHQMLNHRCDIDICANCSQGLRLYI